MKEVVEAEMVKSMENIPTSELMIEVERRSLSCLCVSVRIEEGGTDAWRYRVKGSGMLLGAMTAALQMEVNRILEERCKDGVDPLEGSKEE